jgi:hypothetical protein
MAAPHGSASPGATTRFTRELANAVCLHLFVDELIRQETTRCSPSILPNADIRGRGSRHSLDFLSAYEIKSP